MNSEFELIQYNDNLPARIEIKQGKIETNYHWHKEIELVYVLNGEVKLSLNNTDRTVCADDFVLVNSAENHSLSSENAKCLILDVSYEFAQQFDSDFQNVVFEVTKGSGAEEDIRNLLWQLSRPVSEEELPALRQMSIVTELLHILFVRCRREKKTVSTDSPQVNSRHIKLATEYIKQHFQEDFSEIELAEMLGLHPISLSVLFKKNLGTTFRDYVLKIRLEHAMDALVNKNLSIEDAAAAGGFPSKRTFIAKCKRAYNITPFQLMKKQREAGG